MELFNWTMNAYRYLAAKYLWRIGKKDDPIQELQKARWNLQRCQQVFRWSESVERAIGMIDQAIEGIENGTIELQ